MAVPENKNIAIRKIHIYPVESSLQEKIQHHFERYGEIESIDFHMKKKFGYAFVLFKNAESASAAIMKRKQNIGGKKIKVQIANLDNEAENKIPPSPDSSLNILNKLNDDCLMEIFERLPLHDLCAVADVCTQFKGNANNVFSAQYSHFDIEVIKEEIETENDLKFDDDEQIPEIGVSINLLRNLFRNFGSLMKSIDIDQSDFGERYNNLILGFVATYCSKQDSVLKNLTLFDFTIKGDLVTRLKPVFAHLNYLHMSEGSYSRNIAQLFGVCQELTEFTLDNVGCGQALSKQFGKLQKITLNEIEGFSEDIFERFTQLNPQLERLRIGNHQLSSNIIRSIGSNLPNLTSLHLDCFISGGDMKKNLIHLAQLKSLNKLHVNCKLMPVNELLDALNNDSIIELSLKNLTIDSNIAKSLSQMNNVKHLELTDTKIGIDQLTIVLDGMPGIEKLEFYRINQLKTEYFAKIVENRKNLTYLMVSGQRDLDFNTSDFTDILKFIKNRPTDNKLKINVFGIDCRTNVPASVIKENNEWLSLAVYSSNSTNEDSDEDDDDDDDDFDDDFDDDDDFNLFPHVIDPRIILAFMLDEDID